MIKSIQHFEEISTRVFEKVINEFFQNPTDFASFTRGITEALPKAAGDEARSCLSSYEILQSERNRHEKVGKYVEAISHTLSLNNKRQQFFQQWIWDL